MEGADPIVLQALKEEQARKQEKQKRKRHRTDDDGDDFGEDQAGHRASHGTDEYATSTTGKRVSFEANAGVGDALPSEREVKSAQKRRAAARKGGGLVKEADLELGALETAEERNQVQLEEEDKPEAFTAFNLVEERETGFFDKEGNYFEKKKDKQEEVEDAWLKDVKVATHLAEKVKRNREQAQQSVGDISERQIAELYKVLCDILKPEESVKDAFIRLSGRSKTKTKKASRGLPPGLRQAEQSLGDNSAGDKVQFDKLTSATTTLVSVGELDVYSKSREDFQRASSLFELEHMDDAEVDEDMFADEDEEARPETKRDEHANPSTSKEPLVDSAKPASDDNYGTWPISELKRLLVEKGGTASGITEKAELVERVRDILQEKKGPKIPEGYIHDPSSGYFYNYAKKLYFDPQSGYYYDGSQWIKPD